MDNINRQMFAAVCSGRKNVLLDEARSTLSPFFVNTQALENYATPFQLISAYNIIRTYHCLADRVFCEGLNNTLNIYRQAYKTSPEKTLKTIDAGRQEFLQKESFMHTRKNTIVHLLKDLPEDLYDAVPMIIDCIDKSIELSIQHIIFELLALWNLMHSEDAAPKGKVSFGTAVRTLSSDPKLANLFQIGSQKIYIHDWRNIGAHTTYEIHCNNVYCTYKSGKETACLTVNDLYECYQEVKRTSNIINIAKYIFEVEHTPELAILTNPLSLEAATGMLLKNIQTDLLNDGFLLDPMLSQDGPGAIPVVFVQDIFDVTDEVERSDAVATYLVNICHAYKMNVGMVYCDRSWTPR